MKLIAIELFKLRTQRAMLFLLLAALAVTLMGFFSIWVVLQTGEASRVLDLRLESTQRQLLGTGGGSILLVVFAVVGITGEYRHRTISSTFLATPNRYPVLLAKLVAYVIVAVLYGVLVACISTAGVLALLSVENVELVVSGRDILLDYGRDLIALGLFAGFGLGVGAIVTNQIAGIVIVLVEPIVSSIMGAVIPSIGKFLPSSAAQAFQSVQDVFFVETLSSGNGGLVFLGWVATLLAAAVYLTQQRDIT